MMGFKSYSELCTLETFEQRFNYLRCYGGIIGEDTFGHARYLNQRFYSGPLWRNFRNTIIVRDNGSEMALEDYPIGGLIILHHINPLTEKDIIEQTSKLMDPENIVCVSHKLHNLIHYGTECPNMNTNERFQNDMCPWRK